jgi:hypothetical protein
MTISRSTVNFTMQARRRVTLDSTRPPGSSFDQKAAAQLHILGELNDLSAESGFSEIEHAQVP